MDTKSKSIKHSLPFKFLCLALSAALIALSCIFMLSAVSQALINGRADFLKARPSRMYETGYYECRFNDAVNNTLWLRDYCGINLRRAALKEENEALTDTALNKYLDRVAETIRDELTYVAGTYGDYGEPVTAVEDYSEDSQGTVNRSAVKLTEQALLCKGQDIIQYKYLVRHEAFYDGFYTSVTSSEKSGCTSISISLDNIDYSAEEAKKLISQRINNYIDMLGDSFDDSYYYESELAKSGDILYYTAVKGGDRVFTNTDYKTITAALASSPLYYRYEQKKSDYKAPAAFSSSECFYNNSFFKDVITGQVKDPLNDENLTLIVCLPAANAAAAEKSAAGSFFASRDFGAFFTRDFIVACVLFLAGVLLLVAFLCLCGHKNGVDGIALAAIDKVPTDIHFILSLAVTLVLLFVAAAAGAVFIFGEYYVDIDFSLDDFAFTPLAAFLTVVPLTLNWLVFAERLSSTVRIKKAGKSWFARCAIVKLIVLIFKILEKVLKLCWKFIKKCFTPAKKFISALKYTPGNFKKSAVWMSSLWLAINLVICTVAVISACTEFGVILALAIVAFIGFNAYTAYRLTDYVKKLDTVITSAATHTAVEDNLALYPQSLRTLSDSLEVTREKLNEAINSAVRDERMKTELITNVSHDLKTPLTSIINYVDLLKKTNIEDETAREYLGVLDEKSKRLKSLVEDLVEASKASSGAVTLNLAAIDLRELSLQLLGEMEDDFENAGLSTVFSCPDTAPVVYADGQKTFRIIDNLLVNARKYSAPGTRIYISLGESGGFGTVEIKNISRDPLNITADELMERFVRGDMARTDGGNGLGLSIARDLCTLQGGRLDISVDGDLFKASVTLPKKA